MKFVCVFATILVLTSRLGDGKQSGDTSREVGNSPDEHEGMDLVSPLVDQCFNNIFMAEWWSYVWCFGDHVRQIHYNHHSQRIETENQIGNFVPDESGPRHHIYRSEEADCIVDEKSGLLGTRYAEVTMECCEETGRHVPFPEVATEAGGTVIAAVNEPVPCSYYLTVCSEKLCSGDVLKKRKKISTTTASAAKTRSSSSSWRSSGVSTAVPFVSSLGWRTWPNPTRTTSTSTALGARCPTSCTMRARSRARPPWVTGLGRVIQRHVGDPYAPAPSSARPRPSPKSGCPLAVPTR